MLRLHRWDATLLYKISEMKMRPFYSISITVIVLALCAIVWIALQPREKEAVVIYKVVTPEPHLTTPLTREQRIQATKEKRKQILETRAEAEKEYKLESMRESGATEEEIQAMKKALDSPEYLEYMRKQDAVYPGFNMGFWWDFLESQGIEAVGRKLQEMQFREVFPTGDYVDYEPDMRKKLAALFLEYSPTDVFGIENEIDTHAYTREIVDLFMNADWANKIWMRGYFNGYDGHLDWADNIRQNATQMVADTTSANTGIDVSTGLPITPELSTTEHTEKPVNVDAASPVLETIEQAPQTVEASEVEFMKDIFPDVDIPNLFTNAESVSMIRQHFSPQRVDTAMQTLSQYGLQEGLHRLKKSDPEVATHIERLIQPSRENN